MANIFRISRSANTIALGTTGTITSIGFKHTAGSQASPLNVTSTRQYGIELHYSGNNYDVTGIRSRAQLVTTDTSATAQGALLQAANNDGINAGVLQGALIEAIGKSTTNAATITMMRGCLINTEWSAKDTVTDLRILHVRTHTRDNATEGYISNTGYGIYIENEAVDGNGQALDAGIYFKGTNLSAGNKAFTHGIDFSGATYGTTEIKLKDGGTFGSTGASVNIDSSGKVGIGTSSPTDLLHIKGAGGVSAVLEFTDNNAAAEIELKQGSTYGGGIGFFGPDFAASAVRNGLGVQSGINNDGFIFFRTKTSGSFADRMRILNDGKVGIGTTNPLNVLHVKGGNTEGITIESTGSSAKLQMNTTSGSENKMNWGWATNFNLNGFEILLGTVEGESPNTTALSILNNAHVGIGTIPKTRLTVEGTLTLKEQAAADGDTAAYGQVWCKTATPNELWFTDDTGIDHLLSDVKSKRTYIGGYAIKLTNKTGSNTIAGQVVMVDPAVNDAVVICDGATTADSGDIPIGVFLDSGIADGSETWIVISGIADVAIEDNVAAVRGYWIGASSDEDGYADMVDHPKNAPDHMHEIGHCVESVAAGGGGTHILARCVLHFN